MDAGYLVLITIIFMFSLATIRGYSFGGRARVVLSCSCVLVCSPVSAEIYKWTDDKGQVHYSDRAVAGSQILNAGVNTLPDNTMPGLSDYERKKLQELERQDQEDAKERHAQQLQEENQRRKEALVAKQEQRKCRHYTNLLERYRDKLRAGCSVKDCQEYNRRVKEYRAEVADYCQ